MITYMTENKDYLLELEYKATFFSSDRIICFITFKNNLGITIASIKFPDYELVNLIDNIYAYLSISDNIMYTLKSYNDINGIIYSIGLSTEYSFNSFKRYFTLYSYQDDTMIKILSFEITNTLDEFTDLLYEFFIESSDILNEDTKKELMNL